MLHQLSRVREKEFESLLKLLTNSIVLHADETSWSIKSVWAFLSENSRVVLFGVNKDSKTLALVLAPASYKGTVVSGNAAVYGRFSKTQKCWAHLLRKAIKLTLLDPKNKEYVAEADREAEIAKLEDRVLALCSVREIETQKLENATADSFRLLRSELLVPSLREELFTFISNPARLTESLEPLRASLEIYIQQETWDSEAISANNLSETESTLGRLEHAGSDA